MIQQYIEKFIKNLPENFKNNKNPIKLDLVLDGGIFNGSYLIGALYFLKEMEKRNYVKICRISGCSIGSIVAFIYIIDCLDILESLYDTTLKQLEMNHKEDLEWKAVDLVSNLIHIPSDLLHAHLSRKKEKGRPEGEDYKGITGKPPPKMLPVDSDLRQHVNRRITMNMLNQGHALNAMDSLHKSIESELVQIDPRLPALYSELSGTSKSRFWYSNFIEMLKNPNTRIQALASEAEVFFDDEDQRFEVSATAPCFIFLIQELLKGAFELINEHSFEDMPLEKRQTIAHTADDHADEAWHFLYGPELWRLFARMVPRRYKFGNKLMELLMQLNATDPNRVNKILRTMVEEYYDIKDKGHDFEKHEDLDTEFSRELDKLMQELEQE